MPLVTQGVLGNNARFKLAIILFLINTGAARFAITGTLAVGNTLLAAISAADPDGDGSLTYRWESSTNGSTWDAIGGNIPTYGITAAEAGKELRLHVNYTDQKGFTEAVTLVAGRVPPQLPSISLSLSPATAVAEEGRNSLRFTFTRTGPTTDPLTVDYTVGGTATLGSDYGGIAGPSTIKRVTFSAGSAVATMTVAPIADSKVESPESVTLTLAPSTGYNIGRPSSVTGTLRDSPVLQGKLSTRGENKTYPVDVVTGSILRASLTSSDPSLFPSIELRSLDGRLIKRAIAQAGSSADLGLVDIVTGTAMLHVRSQSGATGSYTLKVSVQSRDDLKNEVFRLTNEARRKAGRPPLMRNTLLERAAEAHVNDMDASNRYLAHTGSRGSRPIRRIRAAGYKPALVDLGRGSFRTITPENTASGQSSATEVVKAWMNSSGHRAAILDPATREIGIGFDYDQQTGATYWVQNFGNPWAPGKKEWF